MIHQSDITLHNPLVGAILIISVIIISLILQFVGGRLFTSDDFEKMQNVGGIYMSAIGTLYSVILGMILVDAADDFSNAKKNLQIEASSLVKVYAASLQMPERYIKDISESILRYTDNVIYDELREMSEIEIKEETKSLFVKIWVAIKDIEPETENQKALYPVILEAFEDATDSRIERITYSKYTVTWIEWLCLIVGGALNIAFTMFFSIKNRTAHTIMTVMISLMVTINLYAVYVLSEPFSGFINMPTERFHYLRGYIKERSDSERLRIPSQRTESETNYPPLPEPPHHSSPTSSQNQ